MSYVWLINQCGLFVDKIKIFEKLSGCGLYTGALNRLKITVIFQPVLLACMYNNDTTITIQRKKSTLQISIKVYTQKVDSTSKGN